MWFCIAESPMGLISPSPSGRCSSVPGVPPSHSLDVERPYGSQGKATPREEHPWADVKVHNIWQAVGGRKYSYHSNCVGLGFQR